MRRGVGQGEAWNEAYVEAWGEARGEGDGGASQPMTIHKGRTSRMRLMPAVVTLVSTGGCPVGNAGCIKSIHKSKNSTLSAVSNDVRDRPAMCLSRRINWPHRV